MVFPGEGFNPQQTLQVHCDFLLLLLFLSVSYSYMHASQSLVAARCIQIQMAVCRQALSCIAAGYCLLRVNTQLL